MWLLCAVQLICISSLSRYEICGTAFFGSRCVIAIYRTFLCLVRLSSLKRLQPPKQETYPDCGRRCDLPRLIESCDLSLCVQSQPQILVLKNMKAGIIAICPDLISLRRIPIWLGRIIQSDLSVDLWDCSYYILEGLLQCYHGDVVFHSNRPHYICALHIRFHWNWFWAAHYASISQQALPKR